MACKQGVLPDFAEDHKLSGEGLASVGVVTTGCVNQRLMARALPVLTAIMLFTGRMRCRYTAVTITTDLCIDQVQALGGATVHGGCGGTPGYKHQGVTWTHRHRLRDVVGNGTGW